MIKKIFIGICVAIAANTKLMTKSRTSPPPSTPSGPITNTIGNVLTMNPATVTSVTGGAAGSKTNVNTANNAVANTLNLNGNNPNANISIDNNLLSNIHSSYYAPNVGGPGVSNPPPKNDKPHVSEPGPKPKVGGPHKPNKKTKWDW